MGGWNGDGTDTRGVSRNLGQGTLTWPLGNTLTSGPAQLTFGFGRAGDRPVVRR